MLSLGRFGMDRIEYLRAADGRVVPRQNQTHFVLILAGLSAAIIILLGAIAYRAAHPNAPQTQIPIMAAQVFVRSELGPDPDDRVNFSPPEETEVDTSGAGRYVVRGWVDRITSEGIAERYDYTCTIQSTPKGDWARENVALFQQ
jgi:hypothetical protein